MADPIGAAAVPGATSLFSSVFQSFKDPRSPYLLTGVLCVACLVYIVQLPNASDSFWLVFAPIAGIFTFLCVLCFFVKAYNAPHNIGEEKNDIEEQFKFSRAFCLAAGIFSIAYLFASVIDPPDPDGPSILQRALGDAGEFQLPVKKGFLFWIAYDICLLHISIFIFYVALRSIKEDSVINTPIFQITLFTTAILVGMVVVTANIRDQEKWLHSCRNSLVVVEDEKIKLHSKPFFSCEPDFVALKFDKMKKRQEAFVGAKPIVEDIVSPAKVVYWYLLLHLFVFESYWLYRLFRIGRFKLDFTFSPEPRPPAPAGDRSGVTAELPVVEKPKKGRKKEGVP